MHILILLNKILKQAISGNSPKESLESLPGQKLDSNILYILWFKFFPGLNALNQLDFIFLSFRLWSRKIKLKLVQKF